MGVFSIILMGYVLEMISDNGDDENVRVDAAVRTVKEWSVWKEWGRRGVDGTVRCVASFVGDSLMLSVSRAFSALHSPSILHSIFYFLDYDGYDVMP